MSNTVNRENSILSAILYSNNLDGESEQVFTLDSKMFTSSYRRSVADKINDETETDRAYDLLLLTLTDHATGTKYERDLFDIAEQSPMAVSVAKRMHGNLETEYKNRLAGRFR